MGEIISTLIEYTGKGFVPGVYILCLICLLRYEEDKTIRLIFGYMPLVMIIVFFLPPFHFIYSKIDGADTYYRFLWLLPVSMTIAAYMIKLMRDKLFAGLAVACAICIVTGSYVYKADNILPAQNRLHLPQHVLDVCDVIMNDAKGQETMTAMAEELVPYVRQYDSRIDLAFGREMLMPQYSKYTSNAVYEAMERGGTIDAAALSEAAKAYSCEYIVLNSLDEIDGELTDYGYDLLQSVDGFDIYVVRRTALSAVEPYDLRTPH